MIKKCVWLVLMFALLNASSIQAAVVLTVVPSASSFNVGDTGFVDVLIHSDSGDALDSYLASATITGGPGALFAAPGAVSEPYLSDSSYVFFNRSANVANNLNAITAGGATAVFGDVSYDFGSAPPGDPLPLVLPGAGAPRLLARLAFNAVSEGSFTVNIDPTSSFIGAPPTFDDFAFSSTPGSFSITAVPEPSSMALVGLIGAGSYLYRRRFAKRTNVA